jgi:hypothetical protein
MEKMEKPLSRRLKAGAKRSLLKQAKNSGPSPEPR